MPAPLSRTLPLLVALAMCAMSTAAAMAKRPGTPAPACATADQFEQPFPEPVNYVLVPGGSFEGAVWKPGMRANENEPWFAGGTEDRRSLAISGTVTSPAMCIGLLDPTIRFFARQTSVAPFATLMVEAVWRDAAGAEQRLTIPWAPDATLGGWTRSLPSPIFANLTAPPPPATGTFPDPAGDLPTGTVQFAFTPSPGSSWRIDDVYVDPYRRN